MPELKGFPVYKQEKVTSCWACAARAIMNYNFGTPLSPSIDTDQALADKWAAATGNKSNADISKMQSASAALADLKIENNTDDKPFPEIKEIVEQIEKNCPMLAIIGKTDPKGKPDLAFQDGHWLVIVGADAKSNKITVFDPDTGKSTTVDYDKDNYRGYGSDNYWENTSYIGPDS